MSAIVKITVQLAAVRIGSIAVRLYSAQKGQGVGMSFDFYKLKTLTNTLSLWALKGLKERVMGV